MTNPAALFLTNGTRERDPEPAGEFDVEAEAAEMERLLGEEKRAKTIRERELWD